MTEPTSLPTITRPRPPGVPHGHRRNLSTEISETARLDVIVPDDSDLDIAAVLAANEGAKPSISSSVPAVAHIKQRDHLFYDEKLPVFVVLEILVQLDDNLYQHYLNRLAVSLEVTAVDGRRQQQSHNSRAPEATHVLFQTTINEETNPRIPLGGVHKRLAVWKLEVPLGHPKSPLNNPRVSLVCSATLRPADAQKPQFEDEYIVSRQPAGINLLEPFAGDPYLGHGAPRLSASRVSRVIPVTQAPQQSLRPLGYAAKRNFGIIPAINIRLRYSRVPQGTKINTIACLDLEVTTFGDYTVTIHHVNVAVAGGSATALSILPTKEDPMSCRPRDDTTVLFQLSPTDPHNGTTHPVTSSIRQLSVTLGATAHISPHCNPEIATYWTTTVDFAPPPAPTFPSHSGIQRAHRPPSLSSIVHGATVASSGGIRPPQLHPPASSPGVVFTPPPDTSDYATSNSTTLSSGLGLTVTFTGPPRVYVGEQFIWSVFVVNRSNRTRKLALIVPPKRKRAGEGKNLPPTPGEVPAEAVVEEGMVFQVQRGMHLEPAELVPLVNDLRIGPLMPSACHTTELRFVALTTGLLALDGVRVVDLNTNETTDCKELPCILSVERDTVKAEAQPVVV